MGEFSIFHWLVFLFVVALVVGVPVAIIRLARKK
jgi:Sec-independent protein translocase protein TatA